MKDKYLTTFMSLLIFAFVPIIPAITLSTVTTGVNEVSKNIEEDLIWKNTEIASNASFSGDNELMIMAASQLTDTEACESGGLCITPSMSSCQNSKDIALDPGIWVQATVDWEIIDLGDDFIVRLPPKWQVKVISSDATIYQADSEGAVIQVIGGNQRTRLPDDIPSIVVDYEQLGYEVLDITIKGIPAWEVISKTPNSVVCRQVIVALDDELVEFQLQSNANGSCAGHDVFKMMLSSLQMRVDAELTSPTEELESSITSTHPVTSQVVYDRDAAYTYQIDYCDKYDNDDDHYYWCGEFPCDGAHYIAHVLQAGGYPIHWNAGQDHSQDIVNSVTAQRSYLHERGDVFVTSRNNLKVGDIVYINGNDTWCWGTAVQRLSNDIPYVSAHSVNVCDVRYDMLYCGDLPTGYEFNTVLDTVLDITGNLAAASTYIQEGQTGLFLSEIRSDGGIVSDLDGMRLRVGAQYIPLHDDGMHGDFAAEDGLYGTTVPFTQTGAVQVTLLRGTRELDSVEVTVIDDPELAVLTDWPALYAEFRDTGMTVQEDEDNDQRHDFVELLAWLYDYSDKQRGVVINLPDAITQAAGYPEDYASLDYHQDTAYRLQMAHLIDQAITNLNVQTNDSIQNVVLLGDDEVVPFYRVYDPTDFYNDFNQSYPGEYRSREIAYPDTLGGTGENATLIDSEAAYIMSDLPYGVRDHQVITRGTWLSNYPKLPREVAFPVPDMGVGRVFAARPSDLITAMNRYDTPLFMTPQHADAALFLADDNVANGGVDFPYLARRSLSPHIEEWFGDKLAVYDALTSAWLPDQLVAATNESHLVSLWGHTAHELFQINKTRQVVAQDMAGLNITHPVALAGFGCHLGYSVGHTPDGPVPVYPYNQALVNPFLSQGVTYFAPSSYAYTWGPKFQTSNLHELVIAQYINHLSDYTTATIGDVWRSIYANYHAKDPALVENDNPATHLFHIAGAYGNVLYGLPTQPIERVQTSPVRVLQRRRNVDRAPSAASALPTIEVTIPHFQTEVFDDGTTLFSIPNGGTHLAPTNGPALPLAIRTMKLPDNVIVMNVNLVDAESRVYQQPVTLARPEFQAATGTAISGTYTLPPDYPEQLFQYRVVQDQGGQALLLSVIPLRYDRDSHQVTLYDHMVFEVDYIVTAPASGPQLTSFEINEGQPLRINQADQHIQVDVAHSQLDNARVMWTFKTPDSFVVASGNASIQVISGTTTVEIPVDTTGWSPGTKDLALYVMHDGEISDSRNLALQVEGIGVYDLAPQVHLYTDEAEMATWEIAVYDEQGTAITNMSTTTFPMLQVTVDGQPINVDLGEVGEGKYEIRLPLADLSYGEHRVRISATDARGITGWREWTVTKLSSGGRQIYLPLVLRQ